MRLTTKTEDDQGKEQIMFRNTLFAGLVALGLTTWGATESFAQAPPQTYLRPQGLVVTQVIPGTTAAAQGIEVGDVIVSVDGHSVRSATDLQVRLGRAGQVAELGVIDVRTGWQNQVTVYPRQGRIGVDVQPRVDDVRPIPPVYPPWDGNVRPVPPVYPPWNGNVRPIRPIYPPWGNRQIPLPLPVNPGDGMHTLPLPAPGALPGR
jgi:membrane-associated protease RseP (regulator of RpoE activity)